jgi:hypothetical protein
MTDNAPWAARAEHTSVVDTAGGIYVIGGGYGTSTLYNDVWRSADQGAAPHRCAMHGRVCVCACV